MATRVIKPAKVRRNELLDAAQALFFEQGYEGTSVKDIIDAVGLSKGAFYHHFKSKEALIDGLVERLAAQGRSRFETVTAGDANAIEKLNAWFGASSQIKRENVALMRALTRTLYRPENLVLRHRLSKRNIEMSAPILAQIIRQGRSEGVFDVTHPDEMAEALLQLGALIADAIAQSIISPGPSPVASLRRRLKTFEAIIARSLDVPTRSVHIIPEEGLIEAILADPTTAPQE